MSKPTGRWAALKQGLDSALGGRPLPRIDASPAAQLVRLGERLSEEGFLVNSSTSNSDAGDAPQPLQFSWHAEPRGSFLKWLVPTVLVDVSKTPAEFERYARATSKFDNIELTIFLNGLPVDTEAFLDGVERNMNASVAGEALRILQERTSLEVFQSAVDAARAALMKQLERAGLELPEEED